MPRPHLARLGRFAIVMSTAPLRSRLCGPDAKMCKVQEPAETGDRLATSAASRYAPSMDRRKFLAAAAAVTGAARSATAKPVRDVPLHANYFGPLYYDEKERRE